MSRFAVLLVRPRSEWPADQHWFEVVVTNDSLTAHRTCCHHSSGIRSSRTSGTPNGLEIGALAGVARLRCGERRFATVISKHCRLKLGGVRVFSSSCTQLTRSATVPYDIGDITQPQLDEEKIRHWINSYALLTLTNASEWTFAFLREHSVDSRNPQPHPVVLFKHARAAFSAPASLFACNPGPSAKEQPQLDVKIRNEGTLVLLQPMTDAATEWIDEHVEEAQFYCNALVVESRYARETIEAMQRHGLVVA